MSHHLSVVEKEGARDSGNFETPFTEISKERFLGRDQILIQGTQPYRDDQMLVINFILEPIPENVSQIDPMARRSLVVEIRNGQADCAVSIGKRIYMGVPALDSTESVLGPKLIFIHWIEKLPKQQEQPQKASPLLLTYEDVKDTSFAVVSTE